MGCIDNRPRGGKYPPKPMPSSAPPRGYADARNKQWRGVNMGGHGTRPAPMTVGQMTYTNVAELRKNRSTPVIVPPEPWQHPYTESGPLTTDEQIDMSCETAAEYRARIEHALSETRRIFEARDAAKQEPIR